MRTGLSVGRGVCEPQCESVKRFSLVSSEVEVDVLPMTADSNAQPITRGRAVSTGVRERGEHTTVAQVYLGDLSVSGEDR